MAQVNIQTRDEETILEQKKVGGETNNSLNKSNFWDIIGFISVLLLFGFHLSAFITWINVPSLLASYSLKISILCYAVLAGFVLFRWIRHLFNKDTVVTDEIFRSGEEKIGTLGACGFLILLSWRGMPPSSNGLTAFALFINMIFWFLLFVILVLINETLEEKVNTV